MSKITILTEDVINKIAAGEVIERPASIVKELVENSLDAGATRILVEILNSGQDMIRVTDNGEGMSKEDAQLSLIRHATSKIQNDQDLFAITTLGFRGEALASIAAVSQLSIVTKTEDALEGFNLVAEGGTIISSGIVATERGTSIEVRNLFFNTPARKKFLKSDAVELRHIIDVVTHYALLHKEVSFKLLHENHQLLYAPAVEDMQSNIASIYGSSIAKEMLKVEYKDYLATIAGYVAKPHRARNDKTQQVIFVNGRLVHNVDLNKAVYDAFHSLLFVNKHPIFILNLDLDPAKVDVNVHPQKLEIKIEQIDQVAKAVFTAIRKVLEENNLIPTIDNMSADQQLTFGAPLQKEVIPEEAAYSFEPSSQAILHVKESPAQESPFIFSEQELMSVIDSVVKDENAAPEDIAVTEEKVAVSERQLTREKPSSAKLPAMKILGQIHKTFFVAETLGGVLFIDQHAAHERVLYERFMKQYMNTNVAVQRLLQGEVLEFSPAESSIIQENKGALDKLGFTLEEFGRNTFILKTAPLLFGRLQPKELIYEVLSMIKEGKEKIMETKEEIVTRMACRSAIMAGDTITISQIEKIIDELAETDFPYTCPHGRPTIIKTPAEELEKKFKRKG